MAGKKLNNFALHFKTSFLGKEARVRSIVELQRTVKALVDTNQTANRSLLVYACFWCGNRLLKVLLSISVTIHKNWCYLKKKLSNVRPFENKAQNRLILKAWTLVNAGIETMHFENSKLTRNTSVYIKWTAIVWVRQFRDKLMQIERDSILTNSILKLFEFTVN